jgi:general secretion pathway protein F
VSRAPAGPRSFLYLAVNAGGGRKLGLRSAASERALSETLRRDRLVLLRSWKVPGVATTQRELSLNDQAVLNDQLAQLLSRGVPLVEALEVVSSTVSPKARPRIERVRDLVAAGASFADSCKQTAIADHITVTVYRAAEQTGELDASARQLAANARRRLAISGKAVTLMIYPIIVLSISIVMSGFVLMVPVPKVAASMESLGVDLPWYTRLVVTVGNGLRDNLVVVVSVIVVLALVVGAARNQIARGATSFARRLPLFRDVIMAQESARFFSVMAAMTRSGIPLADALGVANEAVGHAKLRRQLTSLRTRLVEGGVLRILIDTVDVLPLATRRLLIAAERSGDLDSAFEAQASDLTDEVDRRASRLLAALEPLLIVVMFLLIGSLVMSIMIPMLTMAGENVG